MRQTEAMIRIAILLLLLCACLILSDKAFGQSCSIKPIEEPDSHITRWHLTTQLPGEKEHLEAITPKRWDAFKICEHWLRDLEKQKQKILEQKAKDEKANRKSRSAWKDQMPALPNGLVHRSDQGADPK